MLTLWEEPTLELKNSILARNAKWHAAAHGQAAVSQPLPERPCYRLHPARHLAGGSPRGTQGP